MIYSGDLANQQTDEHFLIQNEGLFITNDEVSTRNQQIKAVCQYNLKLDLAEDHCFYSGSVDISCIFSLSSLLETTFVQVDFKGQTVRSVSVRSASDSSSSPFPFLFERHRILLSAPLLASYLDTLQQSLILTITFYNPFNTTEINKGLFVTTNNESKDKYIHSQGEVAGCHYIFPCFDQINFRATFSLSVIHPSHWICLSNSNVNSTTQINDISIETTFHTTQSFPCYLYALIAGDYSEFTQENPNSDSSLLNLRIFCRKEKATYMRQQVSEIFSITRFAVEFMQDYTGIPYYLNKLDFVFCTNYTFYGMENPGCITFEERKYLLETSREPIKLMRRAYMIFHEVAHLWFGDYTSIDWWNNLFLKEGMATFFGIKMLQEYSEQHQQLSGNYGELAKVHFFAEEFNKCSSKQVAILNKYTKILTLLYPNCSGHKLSDEKKPYFNYFNFAAHTCITYNKGAALFAFLEAKVYDEEVFREKVRFMLNSFAFKSLSIDEFLGIFQDQFTRRYVFSKGLSYLERGEDGVSYIAHTNDQLFEAKQYDAIKLDVMHFNINKGEVSISTLPLTERGEATCIAELIDSKNNLIFSRIKESLVDAFMLNNWQCLGKLLPDQRVCLLQAIFFETVFFGAFEKLNDLFLAIVESEPNPIILHFVLRNLQRVSKFPFTFKQQFKAISLFREESDSLRQIIFSKNIWRYIYLEEPLKELLELLKQRSLLFKYKYLNIILSRGISEQNKIILQELILNP